MQAAIVGERWSGASLHYGKRIAKMAQTSYHKIPGFDPEDMESQLWEVLWVATIKYDPDNGSNFNSFFNMLVEHRMRDLVRHAFREFRKADLFCERLDVEEVRIGVEAVLNEASAEENFLAGVTVHEWFEAGRRA